MEEEWHEARLNELLAHLRAVWMTAPRDVQERFAERVAIVWEEEWAHGGEQRSSE